MRARGSSVVVRPPASGSRLQRSSCSSVLPYLPYGVGKYALIVRSVSERFACNGCRILCRIYGPYFGADCGYCERQKNDCTLSKSICALWLDSTQQLFIHCWYCYDVSKHRVATWVCVHFSRLLSTRDTPCVVTSFRLWRHWVMGAQVVGLRFDLRSSISERNLEDIVCFIWGCKLHSLYPSPRPCYEMQ